MCESFNRDDVSQLLTALGADPVVFFPLPQGLVELGRRRLIVDDLEAFSHCLEGFGNEVETYFPTSQSGLRCTAFIFFERSAENKRQRQCDRSRRRDNSQALKGRTSARK